MRWVLVLLVAAACEPPKRRIMLSCEKFGTPVDVRDFGGCGVADVDQGEAVRYAEQLAKSCGVPVRYCK